MRISQTLLILVSLFCISAAQAAPLSFWNTQGWTMIDNDDGVGLNGFVDPGWGGQDFDGEYLYYRLDGNILSLGLQAGYNLQTGKVNYQEKNYYAGDLALSFNGGGYNYAVDFGLVTKDYSNKNVEADNDNNGKDAAGLYSVTAWNNNIAFAQSAPFAMDAGSLIVSLLSNTAGYNNGLDSYYRTVSFDISSLGLGSTFDFMAHWTMSCGNDVLEGGTSITSVPEPGTVMLLALGLLGLLWSRKRV